MSQSQAVSRSLTKAQKWFDAALLESQHFGQAWKTARMRAINAGFLFLKARAECPEGEWLFFLENNAARIRPRTVRFFIQLAEAAIEWVKTLYPETPAAKIQERATSEVMMLSPKPLVALLRDLKLMRPFGEYDEVKYKTRKLNGAQLELDFSKVDSTFDALLHDFSLIVPDGKSETEALRELKDKCDQVSAKLAAQLEGKVTDI